MLHYGADHVQTSGELQAAAEIHFQSTIYLWTLTDQPFLSCTYGIFNKMKTMKPFLNFKQ